jgi:hypothetical protein
VAAPDSFWPRRLRWRLIGAWRWPLFFLFTLLDAVLIVELPPVGVRPLFFPALFICAFANLFLIGAVAPFLARRLEARQGLAPAAPTFPPAAHRELLVDKIACIILVITALGLLAAGLGNRKVVVADTDRLQRGGESAVAYVKGHAPDEVQDNVDTLNTHDTYEDGFFRMCVAYDDRRRAYCMFVDAKKDPPEVIPDRDTRPNGLYFRTP